MAEISLPAPSKPRRAWDNAFVRMLRKILAIPRSTVRATAIHLLETILLLKHLSNIKTYSSALRIGKIHGGDRPLGGGVHVIFVLRARHRIPAFTMRGIAAFADSGANVTVVINNNPAHPTAIAELKKSAWRVVERSNVGRDFGAYKDAILDLWKRERQGQVEIDRLILANDSIFYFAAGLAEMVRRVLNDEADFIGVTETIEHHHHVQSFLLGFSKPILDDKKFRRYWRSYLPIGTRRWSIHRGEVGLTQLLTRNGFAPAVIYTADRLKEWLSTLSAEELWQAAQAMPSYFHRDRAEVVEEIWAIPGEQTGGQMEVIFRRFANLQRKFGNALPPDNGAKAVFDQYLELASAALLHSRVSSAHARERLANEMIDFIVSSNQMSMGGLLMIQGLRMPILKRDVVFREIYHAYEILTFLTRIGFKDLDEVAADFRARGVSTYLKGVPRFLYEVGMI